MIGGPSPAKLAARFTAVAQDWFKDGPADRMDRAQKRLLAAIAEQAPATLGEVAETLGRGAPAVSRSVDALVRAGLVDRVQDPDNRRRLALRLTSEGQKQLESVPDGSRLANRLERFAASELRAIERAIELLERSR